MYTEHFGLAEFPFRLTSDTRFLYVNRVYQQAFTGVRYGIKLRHGLIVVTGEPGTGKTSLIRFVKERAEAGMHIVALSSPPTDFPSFLRLVMPGLGLPEPGPDIAAAVEDLTRFLTEQLERNEVTGILLDEAQDLDSSTLREIASLSALKSEGGNLLQLVLVGRPELEMRLNAPEFEAVKQQVAVWCRVEPLRAEEVGTYIDRRLAGAGYKGDGLFDRAAIDQIAVYSAGVPVEINVLCDNALFAAYKAGEEKVPVATIHKVFGRVQFHDELEGMDSDPAPVYGASRTVEVDAVSVVNNGASRMSHASQPRPSAQPIAASRGAGLFSRSTVATVVGILLLIAAAGMFYIDREDLSRTNSREAVVGPEETPAAGEQFPFAGGDARVETGDQASIATGRGEKAASLAATAAADQSEPPKKPHSDPIVYMHVTEERDWQVLESIGGALRENGYAVPVTRYATGRTHGDVRFFFVQDRRQAERVKSLVEAELGSAGYPVSLQLLERDGRQFEFAAPGKIEVWLPPLRSSQF